MNAKPASAEVRLLTIKDVAARLNVSTKTIRRWIERRELAAHQLGRQWRITEKDYRHFLHDNRAE